MANTETEFCIVDGETHRVAFSFGPALKAARDTLELLAATIDELPEWSSSRDELLAEHARLVRVIDEHLEDA